MGNCYMPRNPLYDCITQNSLSIPGNSVPAVGPCPPHMSIEAPTVIIVFSKVAHAGVYVSLGEVKKSTFLSRSGTRFG